MAPTRDSWLWSAAIACGMAAALALGCVTGPDYYGPPPPPPPSTWGPPYGPPYQGHMERALEALQYALSELYSASGNKGGHRGPAISLTQQAINEVNAGIAYANGGYNGPPPSTPPPGTPPPSAHPR
jgi:hypothetical protein